MVLEILVFVPFSLPFFSPIFGNHSCKVKDCTSVIGLQSNPDILRPNKQVRFDLFLCKNVYCAFRKSIRSSIQIGEDFFCFCAFCNVIYMRLIAYFFSSNSAKG